MKCPYCGGEMKKGYVQCRDGVFWTSVKRRSPVFSGLSEGSVPLGKHDRLMPNSCADAYNCAECGIAIIPYGKD